MELSDIQNKILQPFADETIKTLATMAGMKSHSGPGFPDDISKFRFKGYAVVADTFGSIEGKILMHHYIETALAIGNRVRASLLGIEDEASTITEDVAEALAEFGNTAIGLAMSALGKANLGIKFNPPYFVNNIGTMDSIMQGVKEIITVPIHVEDVGRFYFNYLLHNRTSKGDTKMLASTSKILVVDDMKMVRSSIRSFLKQLGYTNIIEAANGKEAVEKHAMEEPSFIFMDIVMPEMSGNEALKQIREADKKVPIVMLTSVSDETLIKECEQQGITGYILKPLTRENGADTLSQMLQKVG